MSSRGEERTSFRCPPFLPCMVYGHCHSLWRAFSCLRCISLNIMNTHFILWAGQHKEKQRKLAAIKRLAARNLRKHTTTQYLKSKGRVPSQDFCISDYAANQHQGFHSQTRDLFPGTPSSHPADGPGAGWKRLLASLFRCWRPVFTLYSPPSHVRIETSTCRTCNISKSILLWRTPGICLPLFLKGKLMQGRKESRAEIARRRTQEEICSAVWY